jgi:hypothetical protein
VITRGVCWITAVKSKEQIDTTLNETCVQRIIWCTQLMEVKKKEHLQSDVGSTKHAAVPKLLLRKHAGISFQKKKTCRQQQQYQTRVVKHSSSHSSSHVSVKQPNKASNDSIVKISVKHLCSLACVCTITRRQHQKHRSSTILDDTKIDNTGTSREN